MSKALLLRGGTIVDGSPVGTPTLGDVLVIDGRVANEAERADRAEVIDCSGRVVAPGFIDIHTHSDLTRLAYPDAESRIGQGVTTEVVGNCGMSPAPVGPAGAAALRGTIGPVDLLPDLELTWTSFAEYLDVLDAAPSAVNTAALVGHGTLRHAVIGDDTRHASAGEREAIGAGLDEALDAGAWGLSFGLMYAPGENADRSELSSLAARAAARGSLVAAHLRAYLGEHLEGAVDEFVSFADGARIQISHLRAIGPRGRRVPGRVLEALHARATNGLDVGADAYPYTAGHTTALQLLPAAARRSGLASVLAEIPNRRAAWAAEIAAGDFGPEAITVVRTGAGPTEACGRTLAELEPGGGWVELLLDLIAEHAGAVDVIVEGSDPDDAELTLVDPLVVVGSDGATLSCRHHATVAHPRSFGTFPRALRILRERGLSLAAAVAKLTSGPAERMGWSDRGRIAPGAAADLVVFDPDRIADRATYADPLRVAAGIDLVVVAGEPVLREGRPTGARPGRLLRGGR